MAIDEREGLQEHSQFRGLRNTVPADRFDLGDLAVAENVDVDDSGRVTRRRGHSAAVVSGAVKSLWSDGERTLAVRNETTLVQVQPDYSLATLRPGLTPGLDMSYASLAERVYYSNGVDLGVVDGGRSRSWGLAVPTGQPVAAAIGGVLPAGTYQYAITYQRTDGQESGSPRAGTIELVATGGIRLSDFVASADLDVARTLVYFSKCNGDMLYRVGVLQGSTFDYQMEASMQVPLTTQHLRAPVPGQFVGAFAGRTLVAAADTLCFSEPFAPELYDLRKNFRLGSGITMLAPLENGVFVGTHAGVAWLAGKQPEKWEYLSRLSYGAVRGAFTVVDRSMVLDGQGSGPVVLFASTQGICLGDDSGTVTNLTAERFAYPIQERGAVVIRRHRGMVQALAALQGTEQPGNASA